MLCAKHSVIKCSSSSTLYSLLQVAHILWSAGIGGRVYRPLSINRKLWALIFNLALAFLISLLLYSDINLSLDNVT